MPSSAHCRQHYGIHYLLAADPTMRRLRRESTSQLHGNKNWGAAFLLMEYLRNHPLPRGSSVLDVGCGWGLASLYCAKHFGAQVQASDADPAVFPFLLAQAEVNQLSIDCQTWAFADIDHPQLANRQALIGSDICFWDDMAADLYQLIARAVDAGCERIVIADPGRPPFLAVAEACVSEFFGELSPITARSQRQHRGWILNIENR